MVKATVLDEGIECRNCNMNKMGNIEKELNKKISELNTLNQDQAKTVLKLRNELRSIKKVTQSPVPQLDLNRMENERSRPQSVAYDSQHHEVASQKMSASMRASQNVDGFLSKKIQEAERKIERYTELLNEKDKINQALENEIMRKDETIRNIHSTMESTHEKEYSDRQSLNQELQKQRKEYRNQIDKLNQELDAKREE